MDLILHLVEYLPSKERILKKLMDFLIFGDGVMKIMLS